MITSYHTPVLLKEVIEALRVEPGKKYIDATVGGGGHAIEIVRRGGVLLGIDQDREAIEQTKKNVQCQMPPAKFGKDIIVVQGNFRDIKRIAIENGFGEVDGILFDLGVSSHQFDSPERGFSYRYGYAPLDMRLDQSKGITAKELLASAHEEELYEIFAKFGEEKHSRAIAHALVRARQISPIVSARDLENIINDVIKGVGAKYQTLSRIYQALRIAVNDELDALIEGLSGTKQLLKVGGRLVVISFHSLEDRIVKNFITKSGLLNLSKKPIIAQRSEVMKNIRARSAKMRIAQKI